VKEKRGRNGGEGGRGRDGERKGASKREREVEREGKRELGNIQRAMLMLCSSAGGTHSDYCACSRR
jgi:hypothetical protein